MLAPLKEPPKIPRDLSMEDEENGEATLSDWQEQFQKHSSVIIVVNSARFVTGVVAFSWKVSHGIYFSNTYSTCNHSDTSRTWSGNCCFHTPLLAFSPFEACEQLR